MLQGQTCSVYFNFIVIERCTVFFNYLLDLPHFTGCFQKLAFQTIDIDSIDYIFAWDSKHSIMVAILTDLTTYLEAWAIA